MAAPTNTVAPQVFGAVVDGDRLVAKVGSWSPIPYSFTFQWYRSDDNAGTNRAAISGATEQTYDAVSADTGKYLDCEVTASSGARAAGLTTNLGVPHADIEFVAATPGAAGDSITVAYVDPAANDQALAVTVTSDAISVSLATGATGTLISTAAQVAAAINADSSAAALVAAYPISGTGAGVVTALAATNLAGGVDAATASADSNRVGPADDALADRLGAAGGGWMLLKGKLPRN